MSNPIRVTARVVHVGEYVPRHIDGSGFRPLKIPETGYMFETQLPGQIPIYISMSDLDLLMMNPNIDNGLPVEIDSWRTEE